MNFIICFYKDLFGRLGFWKKNAKIVFLGLENAGKSKDELKDILAISNEKKIPIEILGNKINKKGAISEEELKKIFDLKSQLNSKDCLAYKVEDNLSLTSFFNFSLNITTMIKFEEELFNVLNDYKVYRILIFENQSLYLYFFFIYLFIKIYK